MSEVCSDDRFELIEKAKAMLVDATNIEMRPDEMAVIDSILFCCWQMGWLDKLHDDDSRMEEAVKPIVRCKSCKYYDQNDAPSEVYPDRYWCDRMTLYMPADGFCSFGKRKAVDE